MHTNTTSWPKEASVLAGGVLNRGRPTKTRVHVSLNSVSIHYSIITLYGDGEIVSGLTHRVGSQAYKHTIISSCQYTQLWFFILHWYLCLIRSVPGDGWFRLSNSSTGWRERKGNALSDYNIFGSSSELWGYCMYVCVIGCVLSSRVKYREEKWKPSKL